MDEVVLENYKKCLESRELYKSFGYDRDAERRFVFEKAQPLYGTILEAGTGKGYFALELAKAGFRFTTFDISEEEQSFARLYLRYFGLEEQADFRIENGESLGFKNGSFGTIFSIHTLHHFELPYKVIDELIRVLAPGGKIVLSDFTKEGFELIGKIHRSQGKEHGTGSASVADAAAYLAEKKFNVQTHRSRYQEVLIVNRQGT